MVDVIVCNLYNAFPLGTTPSGNVKVGYIDETADVRTDYINADWTLAASPFVTGYWTHPFVNGYPTYFAILDSTASYPVKEIVYFAGGEDYNTGHVYNNYLVYTVQAAENGKNLFLRGTYVDGGGNTGTIIRTYVNATLKSTQVVSGTAVVLAVDFGICNTGDEIRVEVTPNGSNFGDGGYLQKDAEIYYTSGGGGGFSGKVCGIQTPAKVCGIASPAKVDGV
jgi:hypothetical protein